MSEKIADYAPWNGKQTTNPTSIPWFFPSQQYSTNYLQEIKYSLENNQSYSWIRIGDGELAVLQQEYIHPIDYLQRNIPWANGVGYCGTTLPNIELRDRLIQAIKESDLVGLFKGDPPTEEVFKAIGIQPKNICYGFDNIALPMNKDFVKLLIKYPILIVGGGSHCVIDGIRFDANFYAKKFKEFLNVDVVGTVSNIHQYSDIQVCMDEIMKYDFKLCLVSAGVNAKIICSEMKKRKSAVYLDMGHAWDNCFHPPGKYDEYWLISVWKQNKIYKPTEQVIYNNVLYKLNTTENYFSSLSPNIDKEHWIEWE